MKKGQETINTTPVNDNEQTTHPSDEQISQPSNRQDPHPSDEQDPHPGEQTTSPERLTPEHHLGEATISTANTLRRQTTDALARTARIAEGLEDPPSSFYFCHIEDFRGIRNSELEIKQMNRDQKWTKARKEYFKGNRAYSAGKQIAKRLESFIGSRLSYKNWFQQDMQAPKFNTISIWPTDYDDYSHRVDALFSFVERGDPSQKLTIGMDVTTNGNESVIMDKLTRSYSDPQLQTMFGFSQVSYCLDCNGQPIRTPVTVPRYVVAVAATDVHKLEGGGMLANSRGNLTDGRIDRFKREYPKLMQLKFLAELNAQNELYAKMLPEQTDFHTSQAKRDLDYMQDKLDTALRGCTEEIIRNGYFQSVYPDKSKVNRAQEIENGGGGFCTLWRLYAKGCIEDTEGNRSQLMRLPPTVIGYNKWATDEIAAHNSFAEDFDKNWQKYAKILLEGLMEESQRQYASSADGQSHDSKEPFTQLMQTIETLKTAANRGKLNAFKGLQSRNHSLVLDKTTNRYRYKTDQEMAAKRSS